MTTSNVSFTSHVSTSTEEVDYVQNCVLLGFHMIMAEVQFYSIQISLTNRMYWMLDPLPLYLKLNKTQYFDILIVS